MLYSCCLIFTTNGYRYHLIVIMIRYISQGLPCNSFTIRYIQIRRSCLVYSKKVFLIICCFSQCKIFIVNVKCIICIWIICNMCRINITIFLPVTTVWKICCIIWNFDIFTRNILSSYFRHHIISTEIMLFNLNCCFLDIIKILMISYIFSDICIGIINTDHRINRINHYFFWLIGFHLVSRTICIIHCHPIITISRKYNSTHPLIRCSNLIPNCRICPDSVNIYINIFRIKISLCYSQRNLYIPVIIQNGISIFWIILIGWFCL